MVEAWKHVKTNKGSAGVDGLSIDETPEHLKTRGPRSGRNSFACGWSIEPGPPRGFWPPCLWSHAEWPAIWRPASGSECSAGLGLSELPIPDILRDASRVFRRRPALKRRRRGSQFEGGKQCEKHTDSNLSNSYKLPSTIHLGILGILRSPQSASSDFVEEPFRFTNETSGWSQRGL